MKRRTFLEVALVLGAGLAAGGQAGLRWSEREGFPGMRVRLVGHRMGGGRDESRSYEGDGAGQRLVIVDRTGDIEREVLDQALSEVGPDWRVPGLQDRLADAVHELEARVVDARGRVLAVTEAPLVVRFRAFGFSA